MCKSAAHKGVLKQSDAGYLLIVNVIMQDKYLGSKNNGITSENKKFNVKTFAFIPNN
jgi:hypothetical protein